MWIVRRISSSLIVLLVVSCVLFVMCRMTPTSPAHIVLGADARAEQVAAFDHEHGLDLPVLTQYQRWISAAATSGFGDSYITGLPIGSQIAETLPVTLEIVTVAFVMTTIFSIVFGMAAAFYEGRMLDQFVRVICIVFLSLPGFWLALLLIRMFSLTLEWLPPGGIIPWEDGKLAHLASLLMPALSIALYYMAVLTRLTRSTVIEVLGQDYVRTVEAMGLKRITIWWYILKNALPSFVTMAALIYGYMFGWALIIEQVFNLPGMSRALLTAILQKDYPMVQAVVLVITAIFITANTLSDLLGKLINPAGSAR
ncbi:ABC transporter permease [Glaciimonas sp. PCH181]|uniref:ABC transporter permease n=1 Tax=Glaciimonas sp. PCH181 TaxID=2133943 RepID=UPI000D345C3A|nr:ABC transporter permease [Glaciimonas sp. PCH181]PUA18425.1 ABC transporter permease [Glaciimonas sp. PCH181]